MSKISVNDLSGVALDYAVALAEGTPPVLCEHRGHVWFVLGPVSLQQVPVKVPAYSTGLAGDAIIDAHGIATRRASTGVWYAMMSTHLGDGEHASWGKMSAKDGDRYGPHSYQVHKRQVRFEGATRREAALRCYVASKLPADGKDPAIEIPKELA